MWGIQKLKKKNLNFLKYLKNLKIKNKSKNPKKKKNQKISKNNLFPRKTEIFLEISLRPEHSVSDFGGATMSVTKDGGQSPYREGQKSLCLI